MSLARKLDSAKVRATRYDVAGALQVTSKTIGCDITYKLDLNNVSRTGLLLYWDHRRHVPFIENTIIEMTIDAAQSWLSAPLMCLGKVVRRIDRRDNTTYFGVHIVQIDNNDLVAWESCITEISKKASVVTENTPEPPSRTATA